MQINKYEHCKFLIERLDHYYDTINAKGAFYIGINTFILGGICVGYCTLYKELLKCICWWDWLFISLLLLACVTSTVFTILAIKPYTKDNYTFEEKPSLLFFGGIAKHGLTYLKEKLNNQDDASIVEDAAQQIHSLAIGLEKKFSLLKWASAFLILEYISILPIFYFILKNLRS